MLLVDLNSQCMVLSSPVASPSYNHPGKWAAESRAFRNPGQKHLDFSPEKKLLRVLLKTRVGLGAGKVSCV